MFDRIARTLSFSPITVSVSASHKFLCEIGRISMLLTSPSGPFTVKQQRLNTVTNTSTVTVPLTIFLPSVSMTRFVAFTVFSLLTSESIRFNNYFRLFLVVFCFLKKCQPNVTDKKTHIIIKLAVFY